MIRSRRRLPTECSALRLVVIDADHWVDAESIQAVGNQFSGQNLVQLESRIFERHVGVLSLAFNLRRVFLKRKRKSILLVRRLIDIDRFRVLQLRAEEKIEASFGVDCVVEVEHIGVFLSGDEMAFLVVEYVDSLDFGDDQAGGGFRLVRSD